MEFVVIKNVMNRNNLMLRFLRKLKLYVKKWTSLSTYDLLFACNWLNPFATIYLNFRSFPLKQAVKFPVYVYGRPNLYYLTGKMLVDGVVSRGMIKFNYTAVGAPCNMSLQTDLLNQGLIIFHGPCQIGTGNKIRVARNGVVELGKNVKIADMVYVGCYTMISVGNNSWIVHRCQLLDGNYHYIANLKDGTVPRWAKPIVIGEKCWICNSSTIAGGAVIPSNTIVASNSLVSKDMSHIPNNSIIGGIPAKLIGSGFKHIHSLELEREIDLFYADNPQGLYKISEDVFSNEA